MKKTIIMAAAMAVIMAFTACGNGESSSDKSKADSSTSDSSSESLTGSDSKDGSEASGNSSQSEDGSSGSSSGAVTTTTDDSEAGTADTALSTTAKTDDATVSATGKDAAVTTTAAAQKTTDTDKITTTAAEKKTTSKTSKKEAKAIAAGEEAEPVYNFFKALEINDSKMFEEIFPDGLVEKLGEENGGKDYLFSSFRDSLVEDYGDGFTFDVKITEKETMTDDMKSEMEKTLKDYFNVKTDISEGYMVTAAVTINSDSRKEDDTFKVLVGNVGEKWVILNLFA